MKIYFSVDTLRRNIAVQAEQIESENKWLAHYITREPGEVECIEDCVRNIMDSCTAILENTEYLKGEQL